MLGRFIVVEGLEGAGKTTAIEIIKHFLETKVPNVVLTREPGGTRVGEGLRKLIKENVLNEVLDERCELLMMYAARVQLLEQVVRPALLKGDWVLADRFELSTYAYQGGGRGIDKSIIDNLSSVCVRGLRPDLTLFLDISPEMGLRRAKSRGQTDRFEEESLVFFENVYQAYHQAIKESLNVRIIDASEPLSEVKAAILQQITLFLKQSDYA